MPKTAKIRWIHSAVSVYKSGDTVNGYSFVEMLISFGKKSNIIDIFPNIIYNYWKGYNI